MEQPESSVISVWIGDPVGGAFVDWAPGGDECYFENTSELQDLLSGLQIRTTSAPLSDWEVGTLQIWIGPDQLRTMIAELWRLLESDTINNSEGLRESLGKILRACEFALAIKMGGVFIS